jgi:hypothetical protein
VAIARCLSETGCLVIRDFRVNTADNEAFLNMMERYFEQPTEVKLLDARPSCHYQVTAFNLPYLQKPPLVTIRGTDYHRIYQLCTSIDADEHQEAKAVPISAYVGLPVEISPALLRYGNKNFPYN